MSKASEYVRLKVPPPSCEYAELLLAQVTDSGGCYFYTRTQTAEQALVLRDWLTETFDEVGE